MVIGQADHGEPCLHGSFIVRFTCGELVVEEWFECAFDAQKRYNYLFLRMPTDELLEYAERVK